MLQTPLQHLVIALAQVEFCGRLLLMWKEKLALLTVVFSVKSTSL